MAQSPDKIITIIILVVAILCLIVFLVALIAPRHKAETGNEGLVGKTGKVKIPLAPEGRVLIMGALWTARTADGSHLQPGVKVQVVAVHDLEITVAALNPQA